MTKAREYGFLGVSLILALVVTGLLLQQSPWPREACFMAGIFVLAALLWVTEALPLFATSLLVIALEIIFLSNPGNWSGLGFASGSSPSYRTVLHATADPVLVLFFGGFVLARAAVKEGVDRAMSSLLLRPFGGRPLMVLLGLMLVTALFSMWMSNTATTAMMITLVAPLLAQMPAQEPFRKALVLAVPFAANIGGIGTPVGSPPNAVAAGYLQKAGHGVGFLGWTVMAVPFMLALLVFVWLLLWRFHRPVTSGLHLAPATQPLTRRGWFVVAVFSVTALLWLSDRVHDLPAAVVALLPAVAFTVGGILDRHDINSLDWNILILIGGGIALGAGMQLTGLDRILLDWLPSAEQGTTTGLLAALVIATMLLSTFMSNTAAANLLLPIGISAATGVTGGMGFEVREAALSIAIAASLSMALPVSTPPNAIAYAKGEFSTREMARVGVILGVGSAAGIILFARWVIQFWSRLLP